MANRMSNPYPAQTDPNASDSGVKKRPSSYNEFQRSGHNSAVNSPGAVHHYGGLNARQKDPMAYAKHL